MNKILPSTNINSSQLIHREAGNNYTMETDLVFSDLSKEFLDLTEGLTVISKMNDSRLLENMRQFVKSEGTLGVDILKAETQLKHIETKHLMANFSPGHFSLHKFSGVTSAVNWLSVIIALLIVSLQILICCESCKCCRTC